MEIDEQSENYEPLLKRPEIKRDEMGRFEQHGATLRKTPPKVNKKSNKTPGGRGANLPARGPGRPPGAPNKVTTALKDMILRSLDKVGGEEYLARLAIENSSAYASLLGKVLPSTMQAPESGGGAPRKVVFERVIVWPDGRREIEGKTPKQLPTPECDKDQ